MNKMESYNKEIRIAVVQRVIFHYRIGIYERMARKWDVMVFHGKSVPKSKVVNALPPYLFPTKELFTICKRAKNNPQQVLYFNPGCVLSLMRWNPDLLIIEGSNNMLNNIFIYLYCRIFSKKYIWWGIGHVPGRKESIYRKILTPARKLLIRNAAYCLAYSNYSAEYFKRIADPSKVKVLPNSIDNEAVEKEIEQISSEDKIRLRKRLGIPEDAVVALFVGALEPNKRLNVFIEALKKLGGRGYKVEGLIIGSGVAASDYRKFATTLKVKNCQFLGKIVKGVNVYFQIADIFVLPGRGGLAINQALINGLPVICNTPADGTELDMIENGKNGYLIKSMDVPDLVDYIERMIRNRSYIEMGRNSREAVKSRYNINVMNDILKQTIEDVLSVNKKSSSKTVWFSEELN
jgi:glycosyltransferase involved in cell wall biosynthesis